MPISKRPRQKKPSPAHLRFLSPPLLERYCVLLKFPHRHARFPAAARCESAAAVRRPSETFAVGFPSHRATTLDPPLTFSPGETIISASCGIHKSTRDPNRTSPIRSPRATRSPSFFQQTTRLAIHPAICLNTISPASVESVIT